MTLQLRQLDTRSADFEAGFARLRHWSDEADAQIESRVAAILADVRARGDAAVLEYTARFDGLRAASVGELALTREAMRRGVRRHHAGAARCAAGRGDAHPPLPRAPARGLRPLLAVPRRRRHAARPEGHAAGPRGHLRARRQGGLSVERADERPAGPGGGGRRDRDGGAHAAAASATRWCWPRPMWPASSARSRSAARRRWPRWPTAPRRSRASTRSPARATPTWPAPRSACSARSAST